MKRTLLFNLSGPLFLVMMPAFCFSQIDRSYINTGWRFKQHDSSSWYNATVPGCVHTDLMANKKIDDPYYRNNEKELQWIGEKDWDYETSFKVDAKMLRKRNIELVFEGLDTYADVFLNHVLILKANNMHSSWRVDCKKLLRNNLNQLSVHFNSVFKVDSPKYQGAPYKLQAWPNNDQGDKWLSLYARKAGYEYGWDWGPRLITSGIWRPVYVESWDNAKISNVQVIQQKVSSASASLSATYEIISDKEQPALLKISDHVKVLASQKAVLVKGINKVSVKFKIADPQLWWPNGMGRPNLYTLTYALSGGGRVLDSKQISTGIRSIKIVREPDKDGQSFYVSLNGLPLFIKGSNYIPIDNFLNRVTPARYASVIKSAADAHMNMLRVWGGGIYENDIFYDLCDKNGILVWQDLMFACGMFPSDTGFIANVRQEIDQNVVRLRNHPSIALWCGNNENEISWHSWGWKKKYPEGVQKVYEASMNDLFEHIIPQVVKEADTTRYYHFTSPSTGFKGIDKSTGDAHYYGVWSGGDPFEAYNTHIARFMSEYGFQSFPDLEAVKRFTAVTDREVSSPVMLSHQRALDNDTRQDFGNKNILKYMGMYFKQPRDFDSFLYVSQVLQAKGITTAIEAHRRNKPFCMGTMYWQLNDCWPVASWSGTDYYGNWKALHYAVKKAYQQEMISVIKEKSSYKIFVITDNQNKASAELLMKLMDFNGRVLWSDHKSLELEPNSSRGYFEIDSAALFNNHALNDVVFTAKLAVDDKPAAIKDYYFTEEKDLKLPETKIRKQLIKKANHYLLRLSANTIAKSVYLSIPGSQPFLVIIILT